MAVPPKASPDQVSIAAVIILVSICCTAAARQKIIDPSGPLMNSANLYSELLTDIVFNTSQRTLSPGDGDLQKIALGRTLYFDKRLSIDGTVSCATCHDPAVAFASTDALAIGARNRIGARNAPTILNAKFSGRKPTLRSALEGCLGGLLGLGLGRMLGPLLRGVCRVCRGCHGCLGMEERERRYASLLAPS